MNISKQILLVDDEPRFCESLVQILNMFGYAVTVAEDGTQAIKILSEKTFDLLLLDVVLPDMLGYQLLDHCTGENHGVAAIVLTGHASTESAIEALRKRVYDYLKKPLDHDLLLKTMDQAIKHNRLEKALRASEERSRILAEATWEGIVIHDCGILLDANDQFLEMFGYQAEELLGVHIVDELLSPQSQNEVKDRIHQEVFGSHKMTGVRKNGTKFPIESNCRNLEYKGKKVRVCAVRDISLRIKHEKEKSNLQKQLAIAHRTETLGLMAGSVAHDLNNILSGIVTLPELLLMDMDEQHEYRETISLIHTAGREAAAVVSDLITVARGATAEKQLCNLKELVEGYIKGLNENKLDSRLRHVTLHFKSAENISNIICSTVHINKILMNLIGNAAEEIHGQGTIVVALHNKMLKKSFYGYEQIEAGNYVVISVTDNGTGIHRDDIKRIFEPFYSKKVMGRSGTGLGLSIVWNTMHDHGGFLDLESSGKGTTFHLYFPATTKIIEKSSINLPQLSPRGNNEKILVVDDQQQQRKIANNLLNNLGYDTATVSSGEEAIEYIKTHSVDLLILDMIMESGMSGRNTYERILRIKPDQKAIIASGFAESNDVKQTLFMGASHFIKKPYTINQISHAVKSALSE